MNVGRIIAGVVGWLAVVLTCGVGGGSGSGSGGSGVAMAQTTTLSVHIAPDQVGIQGYVRPGVWAPLAMDLRNDAATARRLICEWTVPDADGDQAQYRRIATVSPQSTQRLWLYAPVPTAGREPPQWSVRVIEVASAVGLESDSGRLLHRSTINPREWARPDQRVIGVIGSAGLGLHPYEEKWTTQERTRVLRGMTVADLPDRWHGLAMLSALIWTPDGGDPGDAQLSQAGRQALREWVRRGGHLVVILPTVGDAWFNSPLKDMLPMSREQVHRMENQSVLDRPLWLGDPVRDTGMRLDWRWFDLDGTDENAMPQSAVTGPKATVLLRDGQGHPMVVAGAYGLGRVTVIGIDLTDSRLVRQGLPNSITQNINPLNHDSRGVTLWPVVFGWRGPVYREAYLADELKQNRIGRVDLRQFVDPSDFLIRAVAMRGAAAPRVALAVLVFTLYWLLAGPVGFMVLRAKGMIRQSWLVFTAVVLVFAGITWTGALILRPQKLSVEHWSVLDGDLLSGQVRVQSFATVLVPQHGKASLTITPSSPGDLMLSPGLSSSSDQAGFIDPQTYVYDAADPRKVLLPMRSTARTLFLVHQHDPHHGFAPAQGDPDTDVATQVDEPVWYSLPEGKLRMESDGPHGNLIHRLPLPVKHVLAIYCPGQGQEPYVWRLGDWPSDQSLPIMGIPGNAPRLVTPPPMVLAQSDKATDRVWGGHLGQLIRRRGSLLQVDTTAITISEAEMLTQTQILSFFDTLPPPDFRDVEIPGPVQYQRLLGRSLDMTSMLAMPRLILLGMVDDRDRSVLSTPVPLVVDGQTPAATGVTMVRWIVPLP